MKKEWIISIKAILLMTILLGVIYPLTVWVIGQVTMNHQVNGSVIKENGKVVGSELLGQSFMKDDYFWSRPSCVADENPVVGSGSNANVTSNDYQAVLQERIQRIQASHDGEVIPVELVTCSASGLDPHLSLEAATFQINRVAAARNLDPSIVEKLVKEHTSKQWLNLFGKSYVNVLQLNQALDQQ